MTLICWSFLVAVLVDLFISIHFIQISDRWSLNTLWTSHYLWQEVGRVHTHNINIFLIAHPLYWMFLVQPLCNELYLCDPPLYMYRSHDVRHCQLQKGVLGCWSPSGSRLESWWDTGGKTPGSSKKLQCTVPKKDQKIILMEVIL